VRRYLEFRVKDDPYRIPSISCPTGKLRIVRFYCADSGQNGIDPAAQAMHFPAGLFTGDPLGLAERSCNLSVKSHCNLKDDERRLLRDVFNVHFVKAPGVFIEDTADCRDAGFFEFFHAFPGHFRIRVDHCDDNLADL